LRESDGDRLPEAGAGTGHDRSLAFEAWHIVVLRSSRG
jgi:hypothetical protein